MSEIENLESEWNGNATESLKKNVMKLYHEPWEDRIVKWDLIEKPNSSNALLIDYEIKKRIWKFKARPSNILQWLPKEIVSHIVSFL